MAKITIPWRVGGGNIYVSYEGSGNGNISISSDANTGGSRSQEIAVVSAVGNLRKIITVAQAAKSGSGNGRSLGDV